MAARSTEPKVTDDATEQAGSTTLDDNVTEPSVTEPGDGPADTTDPTERASSVTPQPSAEALKVGTVNAVLPLPDTGAGATAPKGGERVETYKATRPDGTEVTVTHDLDTGATSAS